MTDDTQTPAAPPATPPQLGPPPPWLQRWEIAAVLAVSLGASALYALLSFIGSLTAKQALSKQTTTLNGSLAPGRPLLDLFMQLLSITLSLAPVFLVFYLLARSGERPSSIGVDAREPGRDLARGIALAAVIGGSGLGLYLIAYHAGVELNVVAESLPDIWWRIPVLLLSAAQNAISEEVIMIGYLLSRLDRLGVRPSRAILLSALLRSPVPGRRRVLRQRRHGPDLRLPLPPLGPGHAADHRALPDRRGDLRRLRAAGRPRVLAAPPMSVLERLWDRVSGSQPLPPAWVVGLTALLARPADRPRPGAHRGGRLRDAVTARRGRRVAAGRAAPDRDALAGPGAAGRDVPGHPQPVRRAGRAGHRGRRVRGELLRLARRAGRVRLPGRLVPAVRRAAPGGRAGPRLDRVFGPAPAVAVSITTGRLRRRPAGPADRRPGRVLDHAV